MALRASSGRSASASEPAEGPPALSEPPTPLVASASFSGSSALSPSTSRSSGGVDMCCSSSRLLLLPFDGHGLGYGAAQGGPRKWRTTSDRRAFGSPPQANADAHRECSTGLATARAAREERTHSGHRTGGHGGDCNTAQDARIRRLRDWNAPVSPAEASSEEAGFPEPSAHNVKTAGFPRSSH